MRGIFYACVFYSPFNPSPGAMAMGSTGDIALAEEVSGTAARELRAVGVNWVYSPVADVNSDERNPVIGKQKLMVPLSLTNVSTSLRRTLFW